MAGVRGPAVRVAARVLRRVVDGSGPRAGLGAADHALPCVRRGSQHQRGQHVSAELL